MVVSSLTVMKSAVFTGVASTCTNLYPQFGVSCLNVSEVASAEVILNHSPNL